MSTSILSQRRMLDSNFPNEGQDDSEEMSARLTSLESEIGNLREECSSLRQSFAEREKKGSVLIDAYKSVLADIANVIEAQRDENAKREESLRFSLLSLEARLKNDLRTEFGLEAEDADSPANSWWPFRKFS